MSNPAAVKCRTALIVAAVTTVAALGGCKDFLKTTNPSAIDPATLTDSSFL